jgi:hypothetical protein
LRLCSRRAHARSCTMSWRDSDASIIVYYKRESPDAIEFENRAPRPANSALALRRAQHMQTSRCSRVQVSRAWPVISHFLKRRDSITRLRSAHVQFNVALFRNQSHPYPGRFTCSLTVVCYRWYWPRKALLARIRQPSHLWLEKVSQSRKKTDFLNTTEAGNRLQFAT